MIDFSLTMEIDLDTLEVVTGGAAPAAELPVVPPGSDSVPDPRATPCLVAPNRAKIASRV